MASKITVVLVKGTNRVVAAASTASGKLLAVEDVIGPDGLTIMNERTSASDKIRVTIARENLETKLVEFQNEVLIRPTTFEYEPASESITSHLTSDLSATIQAQIEFTYSGTVTGAPRPVYAAVSLHGAPVALVTDQIDVGTDKKANSKYTFTAGEPYEFATWTPGETLTFHD